MIKSAKVICPVFFITRLSELATCYRKIRIFRTEKLENIHFQSYPTSIKIITGLISQKMTGMSLFRLYQKKLKQRNLFLIFHLWVFQLIVTNGFMTLICPC